MSWVAGIQKAVRIAERKHIPHARHWWSYFFIKVVLLYPMLTPLMIVESVPSASKAVFQLIKSITQKTSKLNAIVDGWTNWAFPSPQVEALARKRAAICAVCPAAKYSGGVHMVVRRGKADTVRGMVCGDCRCPLSAKVRSGNDSGPRGKW